MEQAERKRAELTLSDRSELRALRDYLSWAAPGVRVLQLPGRERAVLDQLTLLATGDDIVAVVKLLPEFLMSRRTGMSVTIIIEGTPVTLTEVNLDDILPPLARLLALPARRRCLLASYSAVGTLIRNSQALITPPTRLAATAGISQ
jgi:hypothetical protein